MKAIICILLVLALFIISCNNGGESNDDLNPLEPVVAIHRYAFVPESLTIKAGTTVRWVNEDSAPHSVESPSFDSSTLVKRKTFEHTFEKPGIYDYNCGIHPSEKGKIIVEE